MIELPDSIKKKQFLITDDYGSMRILIISDLKKLGVEKIISASSGNEAIKIINQNMNTPNQIEFLITDMMMDDGTGLELTKSLRANPALKGLPILMITSMTDVALIIECVKAGINNYIVKPWEIEDLSKKIVDCIKK